MLVPMFWGFASRHVHAPRSGFARPQDSTRIVPLKRLLMESTRHANANPNPNPYPNLNTFISTLLYQISNHQRWRDAKP
jgi:hypothetical protein